MLIQFCALVKVTPTLRKFPLFFIVFQVLKAVVMNVAIVWDIVPCNTYVFRVENQPTKKPACSRWLGRISCQPGYELFGVLCKREGNVLAALHPLVHCTNQWEGVCKGWFGKAGVYRRP
jgi:hypothetical protein